MPSPALVQAKQVLRRYPSLKWMAEQPQHFDWQEADGHVTIAPKEGDKLAGTHGRFFPVVVTGEQVALPGFELTDYPSADHRGDLAQGPNAAMVFLCTRYRSAIGHGFLYLHYPTQPEKDKIIDFSGGKNPRSRWGHRTVDFVHSHADGVLDLELRAVNSFAGFPITERQAAVLEADSILTMANPSFLYHMTNFGKDALNCVGFSKNRLQNINEDLGQLTGKTHVRRRFSNDDLPDQLIARPDLVQRDIVQLTARGDDRTSVSLIAPTAPTAGERHRGATLQLARNGELLLGHTQSNPRHLADAKRDKFISHDIVAIMDTLLPQVLDPQANVKKLSDQGILKPITCRRYNEQEQSLFRA